MLTLTLAVAQVLLGVRSEARWLRFVPGHLPGAFPYLPGLLDLELHGGRTYPGPGQLRQHRRAAFPGDQRGHHGPSRDSENVEPGRSDAQAISTRKYADQAPPALSFGLRLRRVLRVIPVSEESIAVAAVSFDNVVLDIELARAGERCSPHILSEWPNNPTDKATCVACDWKNICPAHNGQAPAVVPAES